MHRFLRRLFLALMLGTAIVHAQGGPPFITDDPGTPGNKHWEINLGWLGSHNPGESSYQVPDIDLNYGWGDRIQLKYELPLAVATDENHITRASLGESLFGIKWRPYEHHRTGEVRSDKNMNFALGTYPQVSINNPTSAVRRGIVETGPQYYLPLEVTTKAGPISLNGEVGRWIGNRHAPDRWGRGLIAGHEFNDRLELYAEIYDLQDISRTEGESRDRALTVDLGGRQTLDRKGHLRLLFMGGRAIQSVSRDNSQPDWTAYIGLQILIGPKENEVPGEKP